EEEGEEGEEGEKGEEGKEGKEGKKKDMDKGKVRDSDRKAPKSATKKEYWAVITDKTIAYPTSGGQLHDIGDINGVEFVNVIKYGPYIVHLLKDKPNFKVGDIVTINVDENWRRQLAAHHTATHVINAAARQILGDHINQASAKKTFEKAHLDITHYESLKEEQIRKIEERANEIIAQKIPIHSYLLPRAEAEKKYGMRLYQGGAVPGKKVRVVEIEGQDVEACGGTHMHNTSEIEKIKIIKSQKIQDGIVRLVFKGGNAVERLEQKNRKILEKLASLLGVQINQLIGRINELMDKKKRLQKVLTAGGKLTDDLTVLSSKTKSDMPNFDIMQKITDMLHSSPENLIKIVKNHLEDFERLKKLVSEQKSDKDRLIKEESIQLNHDISLIFKRLDGLKNKEILQLLQNYIKEHPQSILIGLIKNPKGVNLSAFLGNKVGDIAPINIAELLRSIIAPLNGKGGGKPNNFQGFIPTSDKYGAEELITLLKTRIKKQLEKVLK
ncbi:MAG: alanine--tRNA ligase-related protein, partial [Promethearchaeota archaeon]